MTTDFKNMILNHFIHQFEGKQKEGGPRKRIIIRKRSDLAVILFFIIFCFNRLSETYSAVPKDLL